MSHWVTEWEASSCQPPGFGVFWRTGKQSPEWCRVSENWDENQLLSRDYLVQKHCFVPTWLYFTSEFWLLGVFPKKKNSWICSCSLPDGKREMLLSCVVCCIFEMFLSGDLFLSSPVDVLPLEAAHLSCWPFLHACIACFLLSGIWSSESFEIFLPGFVVFFPYCFKCMVRAQSVCFAILPYSWCSWERLNILHSNGVTSQKYPILLPSVSARLWSVLGYLPFTWFGGCTGIEVTLSCRSVLEQIENTDASVSASVLHRL